MALFKKKSRDALLEPSSEFFETIIGENTEIHGRVVLNECIRIDGKIIGNVESIEQSKNTVALGASGSIQGDVYAHRILINGKVEGNIYASERVELHRNADVNGDISFSSIGIEHGAQLNGFLISKIDDTIIEIGEYSRLTKD